MIFWFKRQFETFLRLDTGMPTVFYNGLSITAETRLSLDLPDSGPVVVICHFNRLLQLQCLFKSLVHSMLLLVFLFVFQHFYQLTHNLEAEERKTALAAENELAFIKMQLHVFYTNWFCHHEALGFLFKIPFASHTLSSFRRLWFTLKCDFQLSW